MKSAGKDVDDGKQVLSEFLLGTEASVFENHEFCREAGSKPGNEVESKSRKAVFVGNHNFVDISCTDGFQ